MTETKILTDVAVICLILFLLTLFSSCSSAEIDLCMDHGGTMEKSSHLIYCKDGAVYFNQVDE